MLNHKSGTIRGVAAIYNRYDYKKEARDASLRWEARLRTIVGEFHCLGYRRQLGLGR